MSTAPPRLCGIVLTVVRLPVYSDRLYTRVVPLTFADATASPPALSARRSVSRRPKLLRHDEVEVRVAGGPAVPAAAIGTARSWKSCRTGGLLHALSRGFWTSDSSSVPRPVLSRSTAISVAP